MSNSNFTVSRERLFQYSIFGCDYNDNVCIYVSKSTTPITQLYFVVTNDIEYSFDRIMCLERYIYNSGKILGNENSPYFELAKYILTK